MAMFHGDEGILQILTVSFLMEKGMQEFYQKASQNSSYASAAKTFEMLSRVEEKHMLNIFNLYCGLMEEKTVSFDEFKKKMESDIMEGGVPILQGIARAKDLDIANIKDVLDFALEREKESYNFYRSNATATSEANARVVFNEMAESEANHIDIIEKELKSLATALYR